jgi:hypothetical protein
VDFEDDIFSVDGDGGIAGGTEGDVEDGAVFGGVDYFAGEHGVDAGAEVGLVGEIEKEAEGFIGDAVLGVVEVKIQDIRGKLFGAAGVLGEEVAEVKFLDVTIVS